MLPVLDGRMSGQWQEMRWGMKLTAKEHNHWVRLMGAGTDLDNTTILTILTSVVEVGLIDVKMFQNQGGMGVKDGEWEAELGMVGLERSYGLDI